MQARIDELEAKLATAQQTSAESDGVERDRRLSPGRAKIVPSYAQISTPPSISMPVRHGDTGSSRQDSPSYYPSTSAIQPPVPISIPLGGDLDIATQQSSSILPLNEDQSQYWEKAAAQAGAAQLSLPATTVAHLLRIHAVWIYPAFLFTYRPYFLRDTACGGELSSHLLVAVICLHATRFTHRHLQTELSARVHFLLGQTLPQQPSIATIQALLHLSAREIGMGECSKSWLYAGMAFRIGVDLGIFAKGRSQDVDPARKSISNQVACRWYLPSSGILDCYGNLMLTVVVKGASYAWDKAVRKCLSVVTLLKSLTRVA